MRSKLNPLQSMLCTCMIYDISIINIDDIYFDNFCIEMYQIQVKYSLFIFTRKNNTYKQTKRNKNV